MALKHSNIDGTVKEYGAITIKVVAGVGGITNIVKSIAILFLFLHTTIAKAQGTIKSKDAYTKENLQKVLNAHDKVLVDFNAPWCGPCLVMAPKIKKLEKEFFGKIYVERINVDNAATLTQDMDIRSIPLLILFEKGKPIKALEGNQSIKNIRKFLQ
ncbi:MAG: thioredoxin family protein [Chitinophagaceae bacterium]